MMIGSKSKMSYSDGGLLAEIAEIMAMLFEYPVEQITLTTSMDDIDMWDSIQHLNLVLMLEENYSVNFSPKEIERMTDVERVVSMLQERGVQ
jgi:acyl carrier protein